MVDSLEEGNQEYVFSGGFDEAWKDVGSKKRYGETPRL